MRTRPATQTTVIARRDRAIQYAAAIVSLTTAGVDRMPACAGMTAEGTRGHQ